MGPHAIKYYADKPKISTIYVVRELLGLKVRLAQVMIWERAVKISSSQPCNHE